MIKITRIHTEVETINHLDKEYSEYNSKDRRIFYFNNEALNRFREAMRKRREKDSIVNLENIVKYGYVSHHWR
jgi:hypothetical protein